VRVDVAVFVRTIRACVRLNACVRTGSQQVVIVFVIVRNSVCSTSIELMAVVYPASI
jgi:hypothetical protein